jgi:hypothetical protein
VTCGKGNQSWHGRITRRHPVRAAWGETALVVETVLA